MDFDQQGFTVEHLAENAARTPHSVSVHMHYENPDPFKLCEPREYLGVTEASYNALDNRRVRVEGFQWAPGRYCVKLEAARIAHFQTTIMAILRDPSDVTNAERWAKHLIAFLNTELKSRMGSDISKYRLEFRLIGVNAPLGVLEDRAGVPTEVCVLGIVTATSQVIATEIGKVINPFVLHCPLTDNEALPSFAFPFSPATTDRGALYEFDLNHIMCLDDPLKVFRLATTEIGKEIIA